MPCTLRLWAPNKAIPGPFASGHKPCLEAVASHVASNCTEHGTKKDQKGVSQFQRPWQSQASEPQEGSSHYVLPKPFDLRLQSLQERFPEHDVDLVDAEVGKEEVRIRNLSAAWKGGRAALLKCLRDHVLSATRLD